MVDLVEIHMSNYPSIVSHRLAIVTTSFLSVGLSIYSYNIFSHEQRTTQAHKTRAPWWLKAPYLLSTLLKNYLRATPRKFLSLKH